MATTVAMLAPDGTSGEIPQARVQDAINAGFKRAYTMTAPDGKTTGYIPEDRAQDAIKAGFRLGSPDNTPSAGQQYWDALTNPVGSGGREQGLVGGALQVGGQAIKTLAAPFTNPKDTAEGILRSAAAIGTGNPYQVGATMLPSAEKVAADKQQGGNALALENMGGQALGAVEGGRILQGGAEAAAPTVAKAATTVINKLSPDAIKAQAGGLLQSVAHDANQVPVKLDNSGDSALNLMDWQKKTQLGPTINKFLNRITNPKLGPLTYEEARDYYQLLGRMSADETLKLAPAVKFDLTKMVVGLKQDIGNAADQVGRAADYYQGLQDYAKGAKLQEWYENAKDWAVKAAIPAALGGAGATALSFLRKVNGQ